MKALLIAITVIVLVGVIAVVNAPAALVPMALEELEKRHLMAANAPKVSLAELEGTVWSGQSNQAVITIDGEAIPLGVLSWQLEALSLLDNKPVIHLTTRAPEHSLQIHPRRPLRAVQPAD